MTAKTLKEARYWVTYNSDDSYIQSRMWASRDQDTSIQHIKDAIELARKEQKEYTEKLKLSNKWNLKI